MCVCVYIYIHTYIFKLGRPETWVIKVKKKHASEVSASVTRYSLRAWPAVHDILQKNATVGCEEALIKLISSEKIKYIQSHYLP